MNSKEKALELMETYLDALSFINPSTECFSDAKALAVMCVDEIIDSHYKPIRGIKVNVNDYWHEVKNQLNKL